MYMLCIQKIIYIYLLISFIQKFLKYFYLPSFCKRSIASVTRRTRLDRKNETGRFTEFRDSAENGKLIILSREGRSNENLDRASPLSPPFVRRF